MNDGRTELRAKLRASNSVTALVGTYEDFPAIFRFGTFPNEYTGKEGITMNRATPVDDTLSFMQSSITVSCFSATEKGALTLQAAVEAAINRRMEGHDTFFTCSRLDVVPPPQIGGNEYNAPLTVRVRKRNL